MGGRGSSSGGLGKGLESLVGHRHKRKRELTDGTNGGRWQTAVLSGAHEGKAGMNFIGQAKLRGGFARVSCPQWRRHGTEVVGDVRRDSG
jgi:hypothetical protein